MGVETSGSQLMLGGRADLRGALLVLLLSIVTIGSCRRMIGSSPPDGGDANNTTHVSSARCAAASDCASGSCRDGICCDRFCAGPCQACVRAYTGVDDGTCAAVMAGMDPHDDCQDETATDPCGSDGQCDGAGACRRAPPGRQCDQPACVDAHTFASAGICNGTGICVAGARIDCGAYPCGGDGCAKPCTDNAACPNGSYCASGSCQARRNNGDACASNDACSSGFCSAERICCDTACEGSCMSCSKSATGQPDGTCGPVRDGLDPRDDCAMDAPESCGKNGGCNGAGECELYALGTICASSRCDPDGTFVSTRTCDSGACAPAASDGCGLAVCDPESGCMHACRGDGDCTAHGYCDVGSHTCISEKANGGACTGGHECLSGFCVDGVCCDNACSGLCVSCLAVENGKQTDGTCGDVVDGTDPENECTAGTTACGLDGFCGQGRCRYAPAATSCTSPKCVNGTDNASATLTPAGQCDGQGACSQPASRLCPGSVTCLSAQECQPTVCSSDGNCISGYYCNNAGACTAQKPIGGTCTANDQCTKGFCPETSHSDAVCCSTSCPLACQGCTSASTGLATGTCAPRVENATMVCGGACATGYGLCSSGLSCQLTAWTFDSAPTDGSLPYGWVPDDMSGLFYSSQQNHTPGGGGALAVVAGTPWNAAPGITLCQNDPDILDPTNMNLAGKTADAWILLDGPSTVAVCLFDFMDPSNTVNEIRAVSFQLGDVGIWREAKVTIPANSPGVVKLAIRCELNDGWPGTLYIDDVSIR